MRSLNIDIKRLITLAVSNGAIKPQEVVAAAKAGMNQATKLPITQHCGHWRDEHGHLGSMFLATDKDTGALRRSEDGKRVRFNLRSSAAKSQVAQTPGQVLPQGAAGVPQLSPEAVALVQALLAGGTQVKAQADDAEVDFSDIAI